MDNKITYHEQNDIDNTLKLREVLKTLPPFCRDYFRAIDATTTTKTRISYAYDIRIFFQFLLEQNPAFKDWSMDAFTVDVLDQITAVYHSQCCAGVHYSHGVGVTVFVQIFGKLLLHFYKVVFCHWKIILSL